MSYEENFVQLCMLKTANLWGYIQGKHKFRTEWVGVRQDGDKRMPTKEEQKQLYLDALGVPSNSPRRSNGRGIYWRVYFLILKILS